jgi:hypothetical protein
MGVFSAIGAEHTQSTTVTKTLSDGSTGLGYLQSIDRGLTRARRVSRPGTERGAENDYPPSKSYCE